MTVAPVSTSFEATRVRNHVAMAPDRGFTKQLKKLDPDLEVVWDCVSDRWEIWRFRKDEPGCHITTVQTKDRSYRELGQDVLLELQRWDPNRVDVETILDYLEECAHQQTMRKARDFKNKIEAITKETFNFQFDIEQVQVPRAYAIAEVV